MTAHVETAHRPRRRAVLGLVIGLLMLGVPGVVLATIPGRGFVEICKTAAGPGVTGTFNFSVAGVTVPVPVGACSAPVEVPAGTVSVTEEFQPGLVVAGISVSPGARLISRDLAARSVTVAVAEGDASTQTVVTFANSVEFGQLKICKLAGPGVTVGTNFVFLAADRAVNVLAGPAPGGFCAPAGTFLVGTGVAVTETVPSGMQVTNIAVSPSDRATGSPNLAAGRVAVAVGTGVTEVLFTNASAPAATTTTTVPASSTTTTLPGGGVLPGSTTTTAPAGAPPTTSTTLPGGAPTTTTTTLPGGGVLPASTTTTTTPTTTTTTTLTTTTTTTPSGGPTTTTPPGGSSTTTTTVPGGGPTTTVPSGGATTTTLPSGGPTTTSTTLPGAPTTTSTTLPGGGVLPASTTTTSPSGRPTTTAPPTSSPTTTVPRGAPSTTTPSAGATTTTTPPAGSPPTTVGGPLVGGPAPAGPVSRGAPTPALAETGATAWGLLPWATLAALGGLSLVVMGRREPSVAFLAPPLSITVSETGPPPAAEPESAPPPPDVDDGLDELERVLADPPPETPDSPRTDGDNAHYSAPFHRRSGRGDAAVSVRRSPVSGGRRGRRRPAPWSRPLARGH